MDPNDINIESRWILWDKGGGKVLTGLTTRRLKEIRNYYE
jgi:GH24 family phage-related lysozyme (muramidase)